MIPGEVKIVTTMSSSMKLWIIDYELCICEYGLRNFLLHSLGLEGRGRRWVDTIILSPLEKANGRVREDDRLHFLR
jgi:hypothetical protein